MSVLTCVCVTYQLSHHELEGEGTVCGGALLKRSQMHRSQLMSSDVDCEQRPQVCHQHIRQTCGRAVLVFYETVLVSLNSSNQSSVDKVDRGSS